MLSCQKGDTGPQGPAGPQGPQGNQGASGTAANVIYSDWLTVTAGEWKDTVMTNITAAKRIIKIASKLTQPILDSGVILVYLKDPIINTIYQLPLQYNINPVRIHNYIPRVGSFIFYEYSTDGTGGAASTINQYRYVIIPGLVRTTGRVMNWNQMSYAEVCRILEIPE